MSNRKTLGLLLPSLIYSIESRMLLSSIKEAEAQDVNLVSISTGWAEQRDRFTGNRLWVFEACERFGIDAFALFGPGISNFYDLTVLNDLYATFKNKPVVNIGHPYPGIESVEFENYSSFTTLVNYLIEEKQCSKLAFLTGPKENIDSSERERAFRDCLANHKLAVNEHYILSGDFTASTARRAICDFLESNIELPEAIICANDVSATGVIDELEKHGFTVPNDILVTGCDNSFFAQHNRVTLTSVDYPAESLSAKAVQLVCDFLKGREKKVHFSTPGKITFRTSTKDTYVEEEVENELASLHFLQMDIFPRRLKVASILRQRKPLNQKLIEASEEFINCGLEEFMVYERLDNTLHLHRFNGRDITYQELGSLNEIEKPDWDAKKAQGKPTIWVIAIIGNQEKSYGLIAARVSLEMADFVEFLTGLITESMAYEELEIDRRRLQKEIEKNQQNQHMTALGQMVAGLAHETNTPLGNAVLSASYVKDEMNTLEDLIQKGQLTKSKLEKYLGDQSSSLEILQSSLNRITRLVNLFKQLSVHQSQDKLTRVDFTANCTETIKSLSYKLKEKEISLCTDFPNENEFSTYPAVWTQILSHLLLNSIEHGFPEPTPEGTINLVFKHIGNDEALFSITDNGVGIERDKIDEIFNPFYTTTRYSGNSGLGLNIVYNLVVHRLNGRIVSRRNEPTGMVFEIYFPKEVG